MKTWKVYGKQEGQCTYNVTLRRVGELLLQWKRKSITYWSVCAGVRECVHAHTCI